MEIQNVMGVATTSCQRCHRRKKKCDRALPQCDNCLSANITCSFLDNDSQSGTYPVAFVRGLEARIQELESELSSVLEQLAAARAAEVEPESPRHSEQFLPAASVGTIPERGSSENAVDTYGVTTSFNDSPIPSGTASGARTISLAGELTILSLEATAERHLGSSSGLSFAKLTQTVLRRLSPDRADFTFGSCRTDSVLGQVDWTSRTDLLHGIDLDLLSTLAWEPTLFGEMSLADIMEPTQSLKDLRLPEKLRVEELVAFYFAHSHTLYPVINRKEFLEVLRCIHEDPLDPLARHPLSLFRVWMVLAIGASSHCSISMVEESEPTLYYNKALEYFEAAFEYGDMVALEVIMLQVSFSFFNQFGPNTWVLVGLAARMAIGLGLHTSAAYENLPFDVANMRRRIFFSIYMMDRVVSVALGRPFALHDDDVETEAFTDVDDEFIHADGVHGHNSLEPSLMAVTRHILRLRQIASEISTNVYGNRVRIRANTPNREEIIKSLHKELIDWRRSSPFPLPDAHPRVPHLSSNWYDFNYYSHLAMLYRPSPLFPTLDSAQVKKLADAASMSIRQAYGMHRQKRIAYNWLNLLSLFTSTISLIYATTAQPQELVSHLKQTQVIDDLELALSLSEKLSSKFAAAASLRGIIGRVLGRYREIAKGMSRE